ncbi:MAG: hypothetical protein ACR2L5_01585 [Candidatus Actinomarinaceae bacterium]
MKKQTKRDLWAPTTLKFYRLNSSGDVLEDLTEEQRRETEKILRRIIGTSDEFLLTSLASQGEINNFIKEKAAARKNILSNFLDLEIFDQITELAKKDASPLRSKINGLSSENWEQKFDQCLHKIDEHLLIKISSENKLEELNKSLLVLRRNLIGEEKQFITKNELGKKKSLCDKIRKEQDSLKDKKESLIDSISDQTFKIKKIENFLLDFNLAQVKKKRDSKRRIDQNLIEFKGRLKLERNELSGLKRLAKKLKPCDCFEHLPDCKYIIKSNQNHNKLESQEEKVTFLSVKVDDIENELNQLTENYEEKIEKYNTILNKKSSIVDEISEKKIIIERTSQNIKRLARQLKQADQDYQNTLALFKSQDQTENKEIYVRINDIESEIKKHASQRDSTISHIASWRAKRDLYKKNLEEYKKINKELRLYDMFIQATSKRGIPVQLLHSLLPKINAEITKILQGVVGFTIELEADLDSNSMDIYINYGDSRRIVELASGMEKMMASLAIRVALINVSTLPKTNMLIIDEGFGALDETNLESCGKLLVSFKKYFKNILIISHIDAIKDIVDNSIDITKNGVDSHVFQP